MTRSRKTRKSLFAVLAMTLGLVFGSSDANAQDAHYFFGGTGNAKPQLGDGALYMGPGNSFVVSSEGDGKVWERAAVPVLVPGEPAIVTNLMAGLGGQPGNRRGFDFGVCVTRLSNNACGAAGTVCSSASGQGTGLFCRIGSTDMECTDTQGSLAVCNGDRLMVKGTKVGEEEPGARRVKWSFQLVTP